MYESIPRAIIPPSFFPWAFDLFMDNQVKFDWIKLIVACYTTVQNMTGNGYTAIIRANPH